MEKEPEQEEIIPTLGELLPEDQNPEQPPEQPPEQSTTETLAAAGAALLEVKKVEVQSLSEVITALTSVLAEGKSLTGELRAALTEVDNLKLELSMALQEAEEVTENLTEQPPEQPPEQSETKTTKKKIKLF